MIPALWLKVGEKWATRKQPWKDSFDTISWQGFEQEDGRIGFEAMKQQSSLMMWVCQAELTILIRRSKGGGIRQNGNLVQNLARKRNPDKEPSQKGFDGGYEITSRCIAFGSPVVSRYAQSNNITSEQQNVIMTSFRP
jgi:hypothetical protein